MKIKLFALLIAVVTMVSCGGDDKEKHNSTAANGNVYYGDVLRLNEVEDFRSLFPLSVTDVISHRIANQVYEGLVKLSQKDLSIQPGLAESWEISDSAKKFVFHIRKGVKFHDDEAFPNGQGREVTAQDIKYCFDKMCSNLPENQASTFFQNKVIGAKEYYQSTTEKKPLPGGVSGIKVIDDYTLEIDLVYPFSGFLNLLTTAYGWIYPKEAFDKYGIEMRVKAVGTGAFKVKNIKEGLGVVLEKNPNYWRSDVHGNKLPYLDAIKWTFIKEKKSELLEFKNGNIDMVYQLPLEMIKDVTSELENAKKENIPFVLQNTPAQTVYYLGFQHQSKLFSNKLVRQAFNYAIDRNSIVIYTLQGEGVPGNYGIVPPAYKNYDVSKLKGYEFNPEKARKLLAEAGYANGKGFPSLTLQINSGGGDRNIQTAEVVQKMLKENLNIDVKFNVMPLAQHIEALESGKSEFWRLGWIADYPDPENFLNILYGANVPADPKANSFVNPVRYKSEKFDSLFLAGLKETDEAKRNALFLQAEQVAIDDAAIMPIFYDENTRLLQVFVKNFDVNAMEYRDLSEVYIDPVLKEKKK